MAKRSLRRWPHLRDVDQAVDVRCVYSLVAKLTACELDGLIDGADLAVLATDDMQEQGSSRTACTPPWSRTSPAPFTGRAVKW